MDVISPGEARYEQVGDPARCAGCGEPTDHHSGVCCICAAIGPPTPVQEPPKPEYSAIETACRGCMGPCGRCEEAAALVTAKHKEMAKKIRAFLADDSASIWDSCQLLVDAAAILSPLPDSKEHP